MLQIDAEEETFFPGLFGERRRMGEDGPPLLPSFFLPSPGCNLEHKSGRPSLFLCVSGGVPGERMHTLSRAQKRLNKS